MRTAQVRPRGEATVAASPSSNTNNNNDCANTALKGLTDALSDDVGAALPTPTGVVAFLFTHEQLLFRFPATNPFEVALSTTGKTAGANTNANNSANASTMPNAAAASSPSYPHAAGGSALPLGSNTDLESLDHSTSHGVPPGRSGKGGGNGVAGGGQYRLPNALSSSTLAAADMDPSGRDNSPSAAGRSKSDSRGTATGTTTTTTTTTIVSTGARRVAPLRRPQSTVSLVSSTGSPLVNSAATHRTNFNTTNGTQSGATANSNNNGQSQQQQTPQLSRPSLPPRGGSAANLASTASPHTTSQASTPAGGSTTGVGGGAVGSSAGNNNNNNNSSNNNSNAGTGVGTVNGNGGNTNAGGEVSCVGLPTQTLLHLLHAAFTGCTSIHVGNVTFLVFPLFLQEPHTATAASPRDKRASKRCRRRRRHGSRGASAGSTSSTSGKSRSSSSSGGSSNSHSSSSSGTADSNSKSESGEDNGSSSGGSSNSSSIGSESNEDSSSDSDDDENTHKSARNTCTRRDRTSKQRSKKARGPSSSHESPSSKTDNERHRSLLFVLAMNHTDTEHGRLSRFAQCYVNLLLREEMRSGYLTQQRAELQRHKRQWEALCGPRWAGGSAVGGPSSATVNSVSSSSYTNDNNNNNNNNNNGMGSRHRGSGLFSSSNDMDQSTDGSAATYSSNVSFGSPGPPQFSSLVNQQQQQQQQILVAAATTAAAIAAAGGAPSAAAAGVHEYLLSQPSLTLCREMMQLAAALDLWYAAQQHGQRGASDLTRRALLAMGHGGNGDNSGNGCGGDAGGGTSGLVQSPAAGAAGAGGDDAWRRERERVSELLSLRSIRVNTLVRLSLSHLTGHVGRRQRQFLPSVEAQLHPCSLVRLADADFPARLQPEYEERMGPAVGRQLPLSAVRARLARLRLPWRLGAVYRCLEGAMLGGLRQAAGVPFLAMELLELLRLREAIVIQSDVCVRMTHAAVAPAPLLERNQRRALRHADKTEAAAAGEGEASKSHARRRRRMVPALLLLEMMTMGGAPSDRHSDGGGISGGGSGAASAVAGGLFAHAAASRSPTSIPTIVIAGEEAEDDHENVAEAQKADAAAAAAATLATATSAPSPTAGPAPPQREMRSPMTTMAAGTGMHSFPLSPQLPPQSSSWSGSNVFTSTSGPTPPSSIFTAPPAPQQSPQGEQKNPCLPQETDEGAGKAPPTPRKQPRNVYHGPQGPYAVYCAWGSACPLCELLAGAPQLWFCKTKAVAHISNAPPPSAPPSPGSCPSPPPPPQQQKQKQQQKQAFLSLTFPLLDPVVSQHAHQCALRSIRLGRQAAAAGGNSPDASPVTAAASTGVHGSAALTSPSPTSLGLLSSFAPLSAGAEAGQAPEQPAAVKPWFVKPDMYMLPAAAHGITSFQTFQRLLETDASPGGAASGQETGEPSVKARRPHLQQQQQQQQRQRRHRLPRHSLAHTRPGAPKTPQVREEGTGLLLVRARVPADAVQWLARWAPVIAARLHYSGAVAEALVAEAAEAAAVAVAVSTNPEGVAPAETAEASSKDDGAGQPLARPSLSAAAAAPSSSRPAATSTQPIAVGQQLGQAREQQQQQQQQQPQRPQSALGSRDSDDGGGSDSTAPSSPATSQPASHPLRPYRRYTKRQLPGRVSSPLAPSVVQLPLPERREVPVRVVGSGASDGTVKVFAGVPPPGSGANSSKHRSSSGAAATTAAGGKPQRGSAGPGHAGGGDGGTSPTSGGSGSGGGVAFPRLPLPPLLQLVVHHVVVLTWGRTHTETEVLARVLEHNLRRLRPFLLGFARAQQLRRAGHTSDSLRHLLRAEQQQQQQQHGRGPAAAAEEAAAAILPCAQDVRLLESYELYEALALVEVLRPYAGCAVRPVPTVALLHAAVNEFSDLFIVGCGGGVAGGGGDGDDGGDEPEVSADGIRHDLFAL